MKSYFERIGKIGNWQDRKKNKNDPLAHPTILFRHEQNKKDANKNWVPGEQIDLGIIKPVLPIGEKQIEKA